MEHETNKTEIFNNVYLTYEKDVYRLCLYYIKDEHTAKDLMQKAFLQFYLHMDDVNQDSTRAYLFRTVRNLAYNLTRDAKYGAKEEELEILDEVGKSIISIENAYIRKEQKQQTKAFCDSIMEDVRKHNELWYEALNKVYCMEIPQEEVAEELGISKEVLYSRLHRARNWIRKNYKKEYDDVL